MTLCCVIWTSSWWVNLIKIDQLNEAIERELTLYSHEVTDRLKEETKTSMKKLVKRTKETAPVGKRSHHYKDNIRSKTLNENTRGISMLWYVGGSDYRLSHLLNNGHATKDGGRVQGTHFISNAEKEITEEFERRIKEVLEND